MTVLEKKPQHVVGNRNRRGEVTLVERELGTTCSESAIGPDDRPDEYPWPWIGVDWETGPSLQCPQSRYPMPIPVDWRRHQLLHTLCHVGREPNRFRVRTHQQADGSTGS